MKRSICSLLAIAMLTACHGAPYSIPLQKSEMPDVKDYVVLGETDGSSGGFLLFSLIPIMKNDMLERAYQEALEKKGADFLLAPSVDDFWYWTPLGNGFSVMVKGTAAKYVKSARTP